MGLTTQRVVRSTGAGATGAQRKKSCVERGFGVFLLLLAPVPAALGIVARRASHPSPGGR